MWKCKECGGTHFYTTVTYSNAEIDINGEIIPHILNQYDVENYYCAECDNEGSELEDVADWEEDDVK